MYSNLIPSLIHAPSSTATAFILLLLLLVLLPHIKL